MKKIRCLVVDDEELARTLLTNYIQKLSHLELAGTCRDSLEAIQALQQNTIDLMFLDIQMPHLTGIELIKTLAHKPLIVLTTAYSEYAIEAYQLNVIDYLLKPISFERFLQAANKATELIRLQHAAAQAPPAPPSDEPQDTPRDFLLVKSEHKIHRIRFADIKYIQSMREYVAYHTPAGRILSLNSLKSLEEDLPADRFIRIHKSYIISIQRVETLEGNLILIDGEKLPIGANYRDEVMKRLF